MEVWKDIEGYEGLYQVSNIGRIKSFYRIKTTIYKEHGRLLKCNNRNGYPYVDLFINGNEIYKYIHRLVAKAFIQNTENKPCVNHIDGNKSNNNIDNLEWVTYKENTQHALKTGLMDYKHHRKEVVMIKNGVKLLLFDSIREASKAIGLSESAVGNACLSNYPKTAGGFNWEHTKKD